MTNCQTFLESKNPTN